MFMKLKIITINYNWNILKCTEATSSEVAQILAIETKVEIQNPLTNINWLESIQKMMQLKKN